uniref:FIP-RBD domain-containing protein n=1 Tax=Ciona savignyi TaxID=51511 RepID=H2YBR2_CIOSA
MGRGGSCENLSTPYIIDQSPGPFERSFRTSSTNSSPASILSARGSGRVLSSGNLSTKAMSVEVLHRPPAHRSSSGTGDSGTNSSASSPEVKLRSSSMSNICLPEPPSQSPTNRNESNSAKRHSTTDLGKMKTKPVAPVAALYRPKNYYRLDVKELNKVSTIHEEPDSSLHTMSHKELVKLVSKHKIIMSQKDQHIRELEDYIGSLLVKVMMQAPEILDIQSTHVTKL